ncbi:ankyrin repeat domain-containing protein, partial [bacterium]|nr:ankyrin repeat domain-containing protein [bacterium]
CDWDWRTCEYAAANGHLECLKYAHEEGCDWHEDTCRLAAEKGRLECLKYACAHGCPGSDRYAEALKAVEDADERFGVEVALAIHRNGGEISVQEFLPLWRERRDVYDAAHFEATRESTAELL